MSLANLKNSAKLNLRLSTIRSHTIRKVATNNERTFNSTCPAS
jgi:hypothetical protein